MKPNQNIDEALAYSAQGLAVFPLHSIREGRCTCGEAGCGSPGKHPRTPHGLKDATTDPDTIRAHWGRWPDANVGIRTGADSGVFVIDIDPRHGGSESWDELIQKHGPLPPTLESLTGGGGCHLIFAHPGGKIGNRTNVRPGIDVRGDGGYIVAAPSNHVSGGQYAWKEGHSPADLKPAIAPEWLIALCSQADRATAAASSPVAVAASSDDQQLLITRASRYALKAKAAREGERNQRAFQLAGHLAAFETELSKLRLTRTQAIELMRSWNLRNVPPLPDNELVAAVDSGMEKGTARQPHVVRPKQSGSKDDRDDRESQADRLVQLVSDVKFFHTPGSSESEGYATIRVGQHPCTHLENVAIRSKQFRYWLGGEYYRKYKKAPGIQALQDALNVMAAKAIFDGPEHPVAVRIAGHAEAIYLDLCDSEWRAVEATKEGWRVITDCPVKFIRPSGMLPLPEPVRGGSISDLREFANVTDREWPLLLGWLMAALRPTGPYPVLPINGEQGSSKSTLCRVLRSLIDPNVSPLRAEHREARDLIIAASNGWVIALDNLSSMPPWLSDALCRLSTGGGFSARELYSDGGEKLFDAMRPVLINGIEELTTRSDLLDRSIPLSLPSISEKRRQPEAIFWRRFEEARPRILGALLDAVVTGLKNVETVQLSTLPRMADFAIWVTACEPGLGLPPRAFLAAYDRNRDASVQLALESSAIGPAMLGLMDRRSWLKGTAKELLAELSSERHSDEKTRRRIDWPKNPRMMGSALRRIATDLRRVGIEVTFGERDPGPNRSRVITIERVQRDQRKTTDQPTLLQLSANVGRTAPSNSDDHRTIRNLDCPHPITSKLDTGPTMDGSDDPDGPDGPEPEESLKLVGVGTESDWGEF